MPESLRIVRALAKLHPGVSGSRLKRAVMEGQVTVDGAVVNDPGELVGPSATLVWDVNRKVHRKVDTSLTVLHEDDDAIVVVKPAGLLTHPTEAKEKDTLLSRVSTYVARREKGRPYVSVVHRLDKETSGILAFAKSRRGLVSLQAQLRAHSVDRRYVAVVEGDMQGDEGRFDRDIVESEGERKRAAKPGEQGIKAITDWRVLERFGVATLVEARLKTGRTHQIRIHFAFAGHPLVGDRVYRDPRRPPFPIDFPRQALHAGRLGYVNLQGETVTLETPTPPDFDRLVRELRKKKSGGPSKPAAVTTKKPEDRRPTRGRR